MERTDNFIDEYKDIEKAEFPRESSYDEEMQRAITAARESMQKIAEILRPAIEVAAGALKAIVDVINLVAPICFDFAAKTLELYPNKRVVHLAKHAKKRRVRKKNLNRITKWIEKGQ